MVVERGGADWWRGSVTYQIYPRSFMDSDNNGIGDLAGIISRLDYVAKLGVDAIWLSPVFPSPMKDMGYDVSDYTDIDPGFGTLAEFDSLVEKAHKLGLKVIIDQVISHSSDQHPFFTESRSSRDNPKSDWYVWADPNLDGTPPNNWQSIFGGPAWTWDSRRRQYYFHNFLKEQPDWNFHNPEVQDYLLSTMRFWLERGVDGFRLDTVNFYFHDKLLRDNPANYLPWSQQALKPFDMQFCLFSKNQPENLAFLERLRALMDEFDARATVGEVGDSHLSIELMGKYTSGKKLHMAYSFEMLGPNFSAEHFRSRIESFFKGAPEGWPCWAFSNHDVPRHVGRWLPHAADQDALAKQAAAMLLSFEGSVCLYQGEELGLVDTQLEFEELTDPDGIAFWPEYKGRDGCRTPMVWDAKAANGGFSKANKTWLPVKAPQQARAVSTQEGKPNSVLAFYRQMLALRRAEPDLRLGDIRFLDLPEPVLGYERGEAMICLFNLSAEPVTIDLAQPVQELLTQGAEIAEGQVTLAANGFVIGRKRNG
ncbi:alpha-amylase family glycosyl hydrolase [uncultured Paracoccus sp.]|uniref:alpha-amylase family glycosyl hydrolase n=1 Tax=uncultured Paracoccus sp. TaxID=189685 RepID=UPI002603E3FD|nr:alpha-amylase family glycosyl hydrolase [uncultured Paracoccus sp.]